MKKKRILQFPGTMLFGGVGSVVMNLYRNMDLEKVQFDFCVPRFNKGPMDDEIKKMGGRIFHVPQMRQQGLVAYIKSIVTILKDNGPFDAVHVHSVHMGVVVLICAKIAGVKNRIYHVHNTNDAALDNMRFHGIIEWFLKKMILLLATKRYACGKEAGRYIYGRNSFEIINNAINLEKFYPQNIEYRKSVKDLLGLPKDMVIVGNIARFVKEKNQDYFIDLALADRESHGKLFFLLVGDGEEKSKIEEKVKNNHLEEVFLFTGNRNDPEKLYQAMDVFCLPSIFEGLPVSIMEAQACGIPCYVSDSVTLEANINAVSYKTFSLNQNIKSALEAVYSLANAEKSSKEKVKQTFSNRSFEIKTISHKLQNYYISL